MATDFYDIDGNLNIWAERVFALGMDFSGEVVRRDFSVW